MTPPSPSTRLTVSAHSMIVQLLTGGLDGLPGKSLELSSPDGSWSIRVPRAAFPNLTPAPGEPVVVNLALLLPRVEPIPEPLVDLRSPGLILPGKAN